MKFAIPRLTRNRWIDLGVLHENDSVQKPNLSPRYHPVKYPTTKYTFLATEKPFEQKK